MTQTSKNVLIESAILIVGALVATFLAALSLGYANIPLDIPSVYSGDGLHAGALFKGIIENGWYFDNPNLGAPFGLTMGPFPVVDTSHFLLIKMIGIFTKNYGLTVTLFFLGSFVTASATAYLAMRTMGINRTFSACGALLFSLQMYHFIRGPHIFLSSYFSVPIFVAFAIFLYSNKIEALSLKQPWKLVVVALTLLIATGGGVYYAFFGCLLIMLASIASSILQNHWRPLATALVAIAIISISVAINLFPHLSYSASHAPSRDMTQRAPAESEIYGLKLTQMLLPSPMHRSETLRRHTTAYNQSSPLSNENAAASIGLVAGAGFALSLLTLLFLRDRIGTERVSQLGLLNIGAFIYATVGGVGVLFAWYVTPQIRGLNRISIFIAFISLCALMWGLQQAISRTQSVKRRMVLGFAAALGIAVLGWWDQTPAWTHTIVEANRGPFLRDATFANAMKPYLPPGSRVYQLPYITFPEHPPLHQEGAYGLMRWYLQSSQIAWSYGATNLTEADYWIRTIETLPIADRLNRLAASDFDALMVERIAYTDGGAAVEQEIQTVAGPPSFICPDESCALYMLRPASSPAAMPLLLAMKNTGWSIEEVEANGSPFTWSVGDDPSSLLLLNPLKSSTRARVQLKMTPRLTSVIEVTTTTGMLKSVSIGANETGVFDEVLDLPSGVTKLELRSNLRAERAAEGDSRMINFRLQNPSISSVNP